MAAPAFSEEIPRKIRTIFPKSEARQKIAFTLMYYDRWPNTEEIDEIAADADRTSRTVYQVMEKLQEAELFTKEEGSIPLYRLKLERETAGRKEPPEQPARRPAGEEMQPQTEPLKPPIAQPEVGVPAQQPQSEALQTPVEARVDRMEVQIEAIRKAVEGGFQQLEGRLNALSHGNPAPADPPVRETVNPSTPDPDPEPSSRKPIYPSKLPFDDPEPLQGYTREDLLELLMSGSPVTRGEEAPGLTTIEAPRAMIRRMIVEVTTFTQMLYEKALSDGAFEGSFSDFLNWGVAKYFEDRGWSLDWHKWEPARGKH